MLPHLTLFSVVCFGAFLMHFTFCTKILILMLEHILLVILVTIYPTQIYSIFETFNCRKYSLRVHNVLRYAKSTENTFDYAFDGGEFTSFIQRRAKCNGVYQCVNSNCCNIQPWGIKNKNCEICSKELKSKYMANAMFCSFTSTATIPASNAWYVWAKTIRATTMKTHRIIKFLQLFENQYNKI